MATARMDVINPVVLVRPYPIGDGDFTLFGTKVDLANIFIRIA